ncbi:OPT family oligopeptide transporter [Polyangium aurulentum]|uniref:OPT family oligopeptide transporter n=1 Tax=Polyangium aurulentum TaxID=2567896 RepID=UPI00146C0238|nr:OPT family oligopeptide transporter [Polyangium aurulentum]UQA56188.1 OPT/YSL family transporter [Polyangium aurulentum]
MASPQAAATDADPAGAPEIQETISDAEWYARIHRPEERQFTLRAVVSGCLIGSVLSAANLYTGLTIGWTYGASITAAISAWLVFRGWNAIAGGPRFTVLENNTMQTAASAAGAMAGAGLITAVPAVMMITHRRLSFLEITAWLTSVAFLGVCFAIPLKRQMINLENLKFPSGIAAAQTTRALHGEGAGGRQRAAALFVSSALGALLSFVRGHLGLVPGTVPQAGFMLGGHSLGKLTLGLDVNLLNLGAGALVGLRTSAWMAVGATICWAGLVPWAIGRGYVLTDPAAFNHFELASKWCMWPGVTMLVVGGLVSFALQGRAIVRAFGVLRGMDGAASRDPSRQDVEVPMRWFGWGFAAAALVAMATQYFVFGMHPLMTLLAIVMSGLLALVATRAQGETDVNSAGAMGQVTQVVFAALAPGNPQINLMAAGMASAGSNNCGDMMQDLKTGRILGASPRKQFWAQVFGVTTGGMFTVLVFIKAFPLELIGNKYPAPFVLTWKGMAELLTQGLSSLPPYTPLAMGVSAALAAIFTVLGEAGPKSLRPWVPSPIGLGLSFILPASNSYTFLLGAAAAAIVERQWPKKAELYTLAAASGLIAGESVMGVVVAILAASGG